MNYFHFPFTHPMQHKSPTSPNVLFIIHLAHYLFIYFLLFFFLMNLGMRVKRKIFQNVKQWNRQIRMILIKRNYDAYDSWDFLCTSLFVTTLNRINIHKSLTHTDILAKPHEYTLFLVKHISSIAKIYLNFKLRISGTSYKIG